ncbi:MAG: hypothetical protein U0350_30360 [Caldilineaceae bacterium]
MLHLKLNKIALAGLTALLATLLISGFAQATGNDAAAGFMQSYTLPAAPLNIVVEAPGHVWFTLPDASAIGSLVVTPTVAFVSHATPTANSTPYDLVYANQVIWFSERTANKIGRLNTQSGVIDEFAVPTATSEPTGIALAPDGAVWFVERAGNKVGRFDPGNNTFQEYAYTTANAQFEDIAVATNESVWVTAPNLDQVINVQLTNNQPKFVPIFTTPQHHPTHVVMDNSSPNKLPWITSSASNLIGRYSPQTLALWRWYKIPVNNSSPVGLALQDNGSSWNFWFAENASGGVGQLTVKPDSTPIITRDQPLLVSNAQPWGIAVDSAGHVWVAGAGAKTITEWRPDYFYTLYLPTVMQN